MRKIDWTGPLSTEDIRWLRQAGILGMEDRIRAHQAEHDADVPELEIHPDGVTRSALDGSARRGQPIEGVGTVQRVVPEDEDPPEGDEDDDLVNDDEGDDYDEWKVSELEAEVTARNKIEGASEVSVFGTGKDGKVLKADLVKGLRLWDIDNPDAIKN